MPHSKCHPMKMTEIFIPNTIMQRGTIKKSHHDKYLVPNRRIKFLQNRTGFESVPKYAKHLAACQSRFDILLCANFDSNLHNQSMHIN
jgi:hypothetical protein